MLKTFERVRHLGTSMQASAGTAGMVIGLAAQRSIATILAGVQIAGNLLHRETLSTLDLADSGHTGNFVPLR